MNKSKIFWIGKNGPISPNCLFQNAYAISNKKMIYWKKNQIFDHKELLCPIMFEHTTGIELQTGQQKKYKLVEVNE